MFVDITEKTYFQTLEIYDPDPSVASDDIEEFESDDKDRIISSPEPGVFYAKNTWHKVLNADGSIDIFWNRETGNDYGYIRTYNIHLIWYPEKREFKVRSAVSAGSRRDKEEQVLQWCLRYIFQIIPTRI